MSANDKQVDGEHYQRGIQPWTYIEANNLDFFEGNALKYLTRWKEKNGTSDLYKVAKPVNIALAHNLASLTIDAKKE